MKAEGAKTQRKLFSLHLSSANELNGRNADEQRFFQQILRDEPGRLLFLAFCGRSGWGSRCEDIDLLRCAKRAF
jgi:hypothetical protein